MMPQTMRRTVSGQTHGVSGLRENWRERRDRTVWVVHLSYVDNMGCRRRVGCPKKIASPSPFNFQDAVKDPVYLIRFDRVHHNA